MPSALKRARDDGPEDPPPDPPFPPEEIRELHDNEVLGLGFYGADAQRSLSLDLTGSSLSTLNGLVAVMAADMYGNLGDRGPIATPPDLEPLELVDVIFGSTAFYFAPGVSSSLIMPVELGGTASRIGAVSERVLGLIEASLGDDVVRIASSFHPRVASKYVELLDVISSADVQTGWMTQTARSALPRDAALYALERLEYTELLATSSFSTTGTLYEANARSRGFRLERDEDGSIIAGRFAEEMVDAVGQLWNQRVLARIDVATERLRRTGEERRRFTLMGLDAATP